MKTQHDIRIDRSKLHPWLNYRLGVLLRKCKKQGIYLIITEGYRTKEYQDALYAKGRTAPGKVVTNAKGSDYGSQHQWGIAFDVAINDSKLLYDVAMLSKVSKIAKAIGLGWGGDWKSPVDIPHFYLKKWGSTTATLKKQYKTLEEFKKTWSKTVTKEGGLNFFKNVTKAAKQGKIPCGKRVDVFFVKQWYARVSYQGNVGYINKKYIK